VSLRFSDDGPHFPAALIDAILAGDVVFLCGSGISTPQLPGFRRLVDDVAEMLGAELDEAECLAYEEKRYEEVLGSIARRMADPTAVVRAASARLAVPEAPDLDQHKTVLRLSRDLGNQVTVVTTNFDTLLEHALRATDPLVDIAGESFAGQALPPPGGASFGGLIHLHGRLEDKGLDLEATPLVLTSTDYGDAYMRSGWASRFLFDLARCKTIVLLGYSAGDAPVRYFLNVLEADRARFPDLKPVYAFSDYHDEPADAEKRWGTLAVTPIPYSSRGAEEGVPDHAPFWRDLARLADMVERPAHVRAARLRAILSHPMAALEEALRPELRWLMSGGTEPWPVVLATVENPLWFNVFQDEGLWTLRQAEWVLAAWIALRWADRTRFLTAIDWQARLGRAFTERLANRLRQASAMPPFWQKAWRLLCQARPEEAQALDDHVYALKNRFGSGLVLEQDLGDVVALLSPILTLHRPFRGFSFDEEEVPDTAAAPAEPRTLSEFVRVEFGRDNHHGADELLEVLGALDGEAARLLDLATSALHVAVERAVDLDMIGEDRDDLDAMLPSIEAHPQNEIHGGVLPLVQLIVMTLAKVAAADRAAGRQAISRFKPIPGRIGARLLLHAMRDKSL
jgi:hypothetical protein